MHPNKAPATVVARTQNEKKEAKIMARNEDHKEDKKELRRLFPIGSTVPVTLMHVSRSGMTRVIKVMAYDKKWNRVRNVSMMVARVTGDKYDHNHGGVTVHGAGMDMGFKLVYDLSAELYQNSRSKKIEGPHRAGYALRHDYI